MTEGKPYCTKDDLLLGQIYLDEIQVDPEKYIQDAADEIDSQLGFVYVTPIEPAPADPPKELPRPVSLLLKRLNVFIASGRLLMAITSHSEDESTNAYANRLLREASDTLKQIARGTIVLDGAKLLPGEDASTKGPKIVNVDSVSPVSAFYEAAMGGTQDVFRGWSTGFGGGDAEPRPGGY